MKRMSAFFVTFLFALFISQHVHGDKPSPELIAAMIQHESKGDDNATGDKYYKKTGKLKPASEWSYGSLQISPSCIKDYNKWYKTKFVAKDCQGNRELSIKVCIAYIDHYATAERLGHIPTDEDKARIHNGGPDGWKEECTNKYWPLVRQYMK